MCILSRFSHVQLFVTLWTVTCQAPLSVGFSRQEYWSRLPCPPPGDLPDQGIEPRSPVAPLWQMDSFTHTPGKGCTQSERCIYRKPRSMSKWVGISTLRPRPLAKIPLGNEITSVPQSLEWPRDTRVAGGGTACPLAVCWAPCLCSGWGVVPAHSAPHLSSPFRPG